MIRFSDADLARRINSGQRATAIAVEFGCSASTIYKRLKSLPALPPVPPQRPDWSRPSTELLKVVHEARREMLAALAHRSAA
jgi:hypothetical protein